MLTNAKRAHTAVLLRKHVPTDICLTSVNAQKDSREKTVTLVCEALFEKKNNNGTSTNVVFIENVNIFKSLFVGLSSNLFLCSIIILMKKQTNKKQTNKKTKQKQKQLFTG